MTGVPVESIMRALESHALESGLFDSVLRHEPKAGPGKGLAFACWLNSLGPARGTSGLAITTALATFSARLYVDMLRDPQDSIDADLGAATSEMMLRLTGDLDLGLDEVRSMDALGAQGQPFAATAGYLPQDGRIYRVMVINVPYVINDAWPQALELT